MQKELCRSATREARSRMDERFVTVCIVRRRVTCRTHVTSVARATLHGWPFSGDDTPGTDTLSGAFLLPTFLWQGQRKVGAAPHRGNANRPRAKQGKARAARTNQKQINQRHPKKPALMNFSLSGSVVISRRETREQRDLGLRPEQFNDHGMRPECL